MSLSLFFKKLLQGKSIPKLGSLDQIETGSGDAEGRYSGDCDDEDGCAGSGAGEVKRKVSRVSKCKSLPSVTLLLSRHHPSTNINLTNKSNKGFITQTD